MKSTITRLATVLAVGAVLALNAAYANGISFSSVAGTTSTTGAQIKFDGASNFTFSNATTGSASGYAFQVTGDDLAGDALNLLGTFAGTWSIGTVTTVSGVSSAPITGSGTFKINDGSTWFTATLTWDDIQQFGTGSTLNTTGIANLSSISYSGSNASLNLLKSAASGVSTAVSFTFTPAVSLAALKGPSKHSTSFSGTAAALPDGGETVMMLGLALSGLAFFRRKRAA